MLNILTQENTFCNIVNVTKLLSLILQLLLGMRGLSEYCKAYSIPYGNTIIISQWIYMNSGTAVRDMNQNETNLKPKIPNFPYHKVLFVIECFDTPPNDSFLCSCTCAFTYICIQICVDVHVLLWPVSVIDVRLCFIFTPVKCSYLLKEGSLNNSLPLSNPLAILPSFSVQEFIFTWINLHLHKSEKLVLTKSLTSWPESPRQASERFP